MLIFTAAPKVPVPCQGSTRESAWKRWCWEDLISVNICSLCVDWRTARLYLPECEPLSGFGSSPWAREMVQVSPCSHLSLLCCPGVTGRLSLTQGTHLSLVSQRESGCEEQESVLHVPSGSGVRVIHVPTWPVSRLFLCSSGIASLKLVRSSCGQPCDGNIPAGVVSSKAFAAVQKCAEGSDQSEEHLYTWLFTLWAPFLSSGGESLLWNPSCPSNWEELEGTYLLT